MTRLRRLHDFPRRLKVGRSLRSERPWSSLQDARKPWSSPTRFSPAQSVSPGLLKREFSEPCAIPPGHEPTDDGIPDRRHEAAGGRGGTKRSPRRVVCWPNGTPKEFQDPKEEWRNWYAYWHRWFPLFYNQSYYSSTLTTASSSNFCLMFFRSAIPIDQDQLQVILYRPNRSSEPRTKVFLGDRR